MKKLYAVAVYWERPDGKTEIRSGYAIANSEYEAEGMMKDYARDEVALDGTLHGATAGEIPEEVIHACLSS